MSRVAVLGTGIVGTAAAWDLARRGHEVVVADRIERAAEEAARLAGGVSSRVDASDAGSVARLLEDVELVVSGVPYALGPLVAEIAVRTKTHYLDFGGNPSVVRRQLELDGRARAQGVALIPDCGLAPGFANVLAMAMVERLGAGPIDEVRLRVGALPARPRGTLGYQLAFNPAGLINEYAEPCEILRDGALEQVEPLTGIEAVAWPPFGVLEAFHTAGGSSWLPRALAGSVRSLDYKTLRHQGHAAAFRGMLEIGLFDEEPQRKTGVPPRAVLLEALEEHLPSGEEDLVLVRVWARRGRDVAGSQMVDRNHGDFSALARTTAFPTTALADLVLRDQIEPGASTMGQAVGLATLLPELSDVGLVVDDLDDRR